MAQPLGEDQYSRNNVWLPDAILPDIGNGDSLNDEDWRDWLSIGDSVGSDDGTVSPGASSASPESTRWSLAQDEWLGTVNDTISPISLLGQDPNNDFATSTLYGKNDLPLNLMPLEANIAADTSTFNFAPVEQGSSSLNIPQPNGAADNDLDALLTSAFLAEQQIPLPPFAQDNAQTYHPLGAAITQSDAATRSTSEESTQRSKASKSDPVFHKQRVKRKRRTKQEMHMADNSSAESRALPHAVIEERYRKKLIDTFAELRDMCKNVPGLGEARKNNKAAVMGRAAEYIRHLEKQNRSMSYELECLKRRNGIRQDGWQDTRRR